MISKDNLIELLGTYLYVFINLYSNNSIVIGLVVALIIIFFSRGRSDKGQYNPLVTISLFMDGRLTLLEMCNKYIDQILATILAFITYKILI